MKRLLAATVLALALSTSGLAGDIPISGIPSPAPSGSTRTTGPTSSGQIPSVPGQIPTVGAADQVSDAALSAVLTVLTWLS